MGTYRFTWFFLLSLWLILVPSLAASALALLVSARKKGSSKWIHGSAYGGVLASILLFVLPFIWLVDDGSLPAEPVNTAQLNPLQPSSAPDPASPGRYTVLHLNYGSGNDRHRLEFAKEADLITASVNASSFVRGWKGFSGWLRSRYWGFGPHRFPRNGRVSYPQGEGPFPLVLVVHGNAMMEQRSDEGYEYLAQLLASRGYIVVSVDENFLNSSWHSLWHHLSNNDARAWLLLQHLKLWQDWSANKNSPFYGKVDMDEIALIGHSRGGEAVALAAAMNDLSHFPDNANIEFDFHFGIRSIVAIAPVDGQYKLADQPTPLQGVNYLVLHGSYDGDVRSFRGAAQYHRTSLGDNPKLLKSSYYIHRANHGFFNQKWGEFDIWPPERWLLNVRPLLKEEQVQRIAQVLISAFLDTTLKGKPDYRDFLKDVRLGRLWLPNTIYISAFAQGGDQSIARYEENLDVTALDPNVQGRQFGRNLTEWKQAQIWLKWGAMHSRAVLLGWNNQSKPNPSYTISFEPQPMDLSERSELLFSLAAMEEDEEDPIDFSIELVDVEGTSASVPLSYLFPLQPRLNAALWKSGVLDEKKKESEPVFQSYSFPLRAFRAEVSDLDLAQVVKLRFVFNRSSRGEIALDDVGFR